MAHVEGGRLVGGDEVAHGELGHRLTVTTRGYALFMRQLLTSFFVTLLIFALIVLLLGGSIGTPELVILTVLLAPYDDEGAFSGRIRVAVALQLAGEPGQEDVGDQIVLGRDPRDVRAALDQAAVGLQRQQDLAERFSIFRYWSESNARSWVEAARPTHATVPDRNSGALSPVVVSNANSIEPALCCRAVS